MKYKTIIASDDSLFITITPNDIDFTSFPAIIGNPNYDAFLVDAKLTDKEVHALKPDTWFDFPKDVSK